MLVADARVLPAATGAVFAELESKSADMLQFATVKTSTAAGKKLAQREGWKQGDAGTVVKVYTRPETGYGTREGSWLSAGSGLDVKSLYGDLTSRLKADITVIEDSQALGQFVNANKKGLPKVFLFSKKTVPTALYNAMSMEFEGRLDLSIIGVSTRTATCATVSPFHHWSASRRPYFTHCLLAYCCCCRTKMKPSSSNSMSPNFRR